MKNLTLLLLIGILMISCKNEKEVSSLRLKNWDKRTISKKLSDSLISGKTYLSVYSQIYHATESRTHYLTATASIRNINSSDTIFLLSADYFNTKGDLIRSYFKKPIYIGPMETIEIVIDEIDKEGGSGANFLFNWKIKNSSNEPFFEAIMISTASQQGLSFTTQGRKVK